MDHKTPTTVSPLNQLTGKRETAQVPLEQPKQKTEPRSSGVQRLCGVDHEENSLSVRSEGKTWGIYMK